MARLRKIGKAGRYFLCFHDSKRTPKERSVPMKTSDVRAASRRTNEVLALVDRGEFDPWAYEHLPWEARGFTLLRAAEQYLSDKAQTCRSKTLEGYADALRGLQKLTPKNLPLESLRTSHVESYVLGPDVSDATRRHRLRNVRAFLNWAKASGLARDSFDPLSRITLPSPEKKLPAFLTANDLERLLACIDAWTDLQTREKRIRPGENLWLKDVILLAAYTGLRLGELVAARWSWVSQDMRTITVTHSENFQTKTGSERAVPLTGPALETVGRLKVEREERGEHLDGPLLPGPKGNGIHAGRTSRRFKFFVRKARLPEGIHFHSLRHSCGSMLALAGVPNVVIAEVLGHASTATTQVYIHAATSHVRDAMDKAFSESRKNHGAQGPLIISSN